MIAEYLSKVILFDNPWLEGRGLADWYQEHLPVRYIPRSMELKPDKRICLVVGPRQAGKTTLIWKTASLTDKPCLYLNCEEPAMREWLVSPASFLSDASEIIENSVPIFFDEIQYLDSAGLFLKGIADRHTQHAVFATGSSAFDLEAETRESLAGRAIRNLLLPLSLKEITGKEKRSILNRTKNRSLAQNLMIYGGYPLVHTSSNPVFELTTLVESFVIRDASDRLKIRKPAAFRKILELIATQIGNLCNFSEWAAISGVSPDTVREYVGILEDSHLVRLISPFVGGKRAEVTSMPKAYFIDNGIRNQIFGGFAEFERRIDRGAILENFVFSEIWKTMNPILDSIRYWRSKSGAEVDFVFEHQGILLAFEVKAGMSRNKITRSARSFIEAYQPEVFYFVSEQEFPEIEIGKTRARFVNYQKIGSVINRIVTQ